MCSMHGVYERYYTSLYFLQVLHCLQITGVIDATRCHGHHFISMRVLMALSQTCWQHVNVLSTGGILSLTSRDGGWWEIIVPSCDLGMVGRVRMMRKRLVCISTCLSEYTTPLNPLQYTFPLKLPLSVPSVSTHIGASALMVLLILQQVVSDGGYAPRPFQDIVEDAG